MTNIYVSQVAVTCACDPRVSIILVAVHFYAIDTQRLYARITRALACVLTGNGGLGTDPPSTVDW